MGILKWKTILKENTVVSTILISFGGYIIVIGTFLDIWPESIYPELTVSMMNRLADVIAIVNLSALCLIIVGWYWIRRGDVEKHRRAMLTSFGLIILFLMLKFFLSKYIYNLFFFYVIKFATLNNISILLKAIYPSLKFERKSKIPKFYHSKNGITKIIFKNDYLKILERILTKFNEAPIKLAAVARTS